MPRNHRADTSAVRLETPPFFDLRIGGVRLTIQRPPYRLLSLLTAVGGMAGGTAWWGR